MKIYVEWKKEEIGFVFTPSIFKSQSKWNVRRAKKKRIHIHDNSLHKFLQYFVWQYDFALVKRKQNLSVEMFD